MSTTHDTPTTPAGSVERPVELYPRGTLVFSAKHGQRVLRRPSAMKPGTKCFAAYRDVGERGTWIPCEELQVVQPNTTAETRQTAQKDTP